MSVQLPGGKFPIPVLIQKKTVIVRIIPVYFRLVNSGKKIVWKVLFLHMKGDYELMLSSENKVDVPYKGSFQILIITQLI